MGFNSKYSGIEVENLLDKIPKDNTIIHSSNIGSYAPIYNSAGNVLIGTTTDNGAKLYIKDTRTDRLGGNLKVDGSGTAWGFSYMSIGLCHNGEGKGGFGWNSVQLSNGANNTAGIYIANDISGDHINLYNEGGIYAYTSSFQTNGNIIAGGNVGIGITSPSYKLDVNGTAKFTSIHTPAASTFNKWCDSYNSYEINQMANVNDGAPSGYPYGYLTTYRWNDGSWSGQMYLTVADFGGEIFTRGYRDDQGKWTIWRKALLDDGYGNYTVSGNIHTNGSITQDSDINLKNKVKDVLLSVDDIAEAPLFEFTYKSDKDKRVHVGTSAQYWASKNNWFCNKQDSGYYDMEIQNCALASAISIAREFKKYKEEASETISKLQKEIEMLKEVVSNINLQLKIA